MIVAFLYGWELTLVLLCMIPLMSVATAITTKVTTTLAEQELSAYAKVGTFKANSYMDIVHETNP